MKLLYAKMYFSRGRCSRESKKTSLLHPNQLSLIPDSFHSFLPRVCIYRTRYILYFASSINWRVKQRSYSVENYTGVAFWGSQQSPQSLQRFRWQIFFTGFTKEIRDIKVVYVNLVVSSSEV